MKLSLRERRQLRGSEIALIVIALIGFAIVIWLAWLRPQPGIHSYDACVKKGNPVLESYPSVCVTHDGKRFANPHEKAPTP